MPELVCLSMILGNALGRSLSPSSNSSWCICFTDPCGSRRKPRADNRSLCLVNRHHSFFIHPLQGSLNHFPDVLRSAVEKKAALFIVEAKFGCDSDSVADRRERLSDKFFVCVGTV